MSAAEYDDGRPAPSAPSRAPGAGRAARGVAARALGAGVAGVGKLARDVRWFLRGITREDTYDRYVAHRARHHPGEEPMSRREFWRERMDWEDRNPQGRCC